ncbi:MAG: ThuA domain-containing protein [Bacteroidota bacterium]
MKRILITAALVAIAGVVYFTVFSKGKQETKLLVFSKTEGFRHESIEAGQEAIKELGLQNNFKVVATEDPQVFKESYLKDFQVIIFLNTTGDILDPVQQSQMERFIQAGGGFVGIHSATDTEYAWEWYGKLVGAYFNGHPNNPNVRKAAVDVLNKNHPATDSLPERWETEDEWYNYKSINPDINVLINLDETSYEGGTNGAEHPVAWYHEYDGGRAFYTGMGHTIESFSSPLFLNHLLGGIKYAAGNGVELDFSKAYAEPIPEENRFMKVVFSENLYEPMEFDFLDETHIIFVERRGSIKVQNTITKVLTEVATLNVHTGHEDGLLGVAVDPDYKNNNWVYLFYSPVGDVPKQHVSRFKLSDNTLDFDSEKILLEIPTQREECCHSGGSLEFAPDGSLFISVGDNTNPHASEGYAPIDEREGRNPWDAQKSSANTNDYRGKILRIKPENDGTYTIPDGNLFAKDGSEGKPEIYVMGCRNPFRISIDAKTGYLYWGDVGPDANKDTLSRGPKGHDEVNQAKKAGNFGWPYFVGNNKPYKDFDFTSNTSGEAFDPNKPINNSPNNTGVKTLPPAQPAMIWYPYSNSEEFPTIGSGARNAMAGPVYHYENYADSEIRFPEFFNEKLLVYDWMRQWIFLTSFDEDGNFEKLIPFLPNMHFDNIIDMAFGPDGALYLLEYGRGWFAQNPEAKLARIEYIEGNRIPIAKIEADKTIGAAPLTVNFIGKNSIDYDGDPLTFAWQFNNEAEGTSTKPDPVFIFDKPGKYEVKLKVTDKEGEVSEVSKEILVGNELAELTWEFQSGNSSFFLDEQPFNLAYNVKVTDKEDGIIKPKDILVTFNYLPEGYDITEAAQGHQALVNASLGMIGKSLMDKSDCNACHKEADKSIGPSFKAIAEKYKSDNNAIDYLAGKILNGGGGVWGETAMAAHPSLTEEQAGQMVKYILSLEGDAVKMPNKYTGQGTFSSKEHLNSNGEGAYVLTASYMDKGGDVIGPLTASETVIIRNARVQAENYTKGENAPKFPVKAADTPGVDEDMTIVIGAKDGYFMMEGIDLTGINSITAKIAFAPGITKGGVMEVRSGAADGTLLGEIQLVQSLTRLGLEEVDITIKQVEGKQDVYFVFKTDNADDNVITVVDWVYFRNKKTQ